MYCLAQFCRICMTNDGSLINLHSSDGDMISFYFKLKQCFPEIVCEATSIHTFICKNCCANLRKVFKFRKLYLRSETILKGYILQLEKANSLSNCVSNKLLELLANNARDPSLLQPYVQKSTESNLKIIDIETIKMNSYVSETTLVLNEIKIENRDHSSKILDDECSHNDLFKFECSMYVENEHDVSDHISSNRNYSTRLQPIEKQTIQENITRGLTEVIHSKTTRPSENNQNERWLQTNCNTGLTIPATTNRFSPADSIQLKTKCVIPSYRLKKSAIEHSFECEVCKKTFSRLGNLKSHQLMHTDENPFACEICSKGFTTSSSLRKHHIIHTGEKPHVCEICNKRFTQLGTLNSHKLVHVDDKPHVCDVCHKGFTRSSILNIHKLIHTGERPHVCKLCNKGFARSDILNNHKLTHTGAKPYVCEICNKGFNQYGTLKTHKLTHTGEKPFVCEICTKGFTTSSNLKTHKQKHLPSEQLCFPV